MSEPRKGGETVELSGEDLGEFAARRKAVVDILDRARGFPERTPERSLVGCEAVTARVAQGMGADADDAVRIGNLLLGAGHFRRVLGGKVTVKNGDIPAR